MTAPVANDPFIEGLNPRQAEAVLAVDGPLLILAGAGSGKTRVLTRRIAYILATGRARRHQILAVTFTNKAAREMAERVEELCGPGRFPDLGTFHSVCSRWLRRYGHLIGLDSSFTIFATAEQQILIKEVLDDLNIDAKRFRPQGFLSKISGWKNSMIRPELAERTARFEAERQQAKVYALYQRKLSQNRALDFDDLLLTTVDLLQDDTELRTQLQEKLRYLSIDEYQDVNPVQYELIRLLAPPEQNVCAVGDDDQSIYAFRGADLSIILRFEKDFPNARVIRLEQNYRSTKPILDAANAVIAHNTSRKQKNLWTDREGGQRLELFVGYDGRDEGRFITSTIAKLRRGAESTPKLSDMVVLYRTNAQSRLLEEALIQAGLPYQILGGLRFFDRKEIKDLLSYLRILQNPADSVSLRRAINEPKRGIGASSVERLLAFAEETQMPLFYALERASEAGLKGKALKSATEFFQWMQDLAQRMAGPEPHELTELLNEVLERSGYRTALRAERTVEAEARLENIEELLNVTREFDRGRREGPVEDDELEDPLEAFLVEVSLLSDQDRSDPDSDMVTLMTLHSAKGLEFPIVFLTGLEEETFPHIRSLSDPEQMEEERRLCYVGLTRAKDQLFLSAARTRALGPDVRVCKLSRFLEEIPEELLSIAASSGSYTASPKSSPGQPDASWSDSGSIGSSSWKGWGKSVPTARVQPTPSLFRKGDTVMHKVFGKGKVEDLGSGDIVTVLFHNGVTRKLKGNFLKKVDAR